jgi:hypothetical protein
MEQFVLKEQAFKAWQHAVAADRTELSLIDWCDLWWKPGFAKYDSAMNSFMAAKIEWEARQDSRLHQKTNVLSW